jgi:hypothetical protein
VLVSAAAHSCNIEEMMVMAAANYWLFSPSTRTKTLILVLGSHPSPFPGSSRNQKIFIFDFQE